MTIADLQKLHIRLTSLIKQVDAETAAELEALREQLNDLEGLTLQLLNAITERVRALERRPSVVMSGGGGAGGVGPQGPAGPPGPPGPVANGYFPGGW